MVLTTQAIERLEEEYSDKLENYFLTFFGETEHREALNSLEEALKTDVIAQFSKDIKILMENSGATTYNIHHLRN